MRVARTAKILLAYLNYPKSLAVSPTPVYGPLSKGDVKHSVAGIAKAKRLLGYYLETRLESNLKILLEGVS
jgi:nucleoside-diphosphate-sugar epimerase